MRPPSLRRMVSVVLGIGIFGTVVVGAASSIVHAQSPAEVEAEPIVKLEPGETPVSGQCLTRQELDLIDGLNRLRRPTVGVEGEEQGDDSAPFDPHYFIGTWKIEGVLPESPLGAGEFLGTETIRYRDGCTYESTTTGAIGDEPIEIESLLVYDRRAKYLVRIEEDSRGFQLVKTGPIGGDPGGYSSHHWEAPSIIRHGQRVRVRGRTYMTSPSAFRIRRQVSIDDERFVNSGTVWWERLEP